MKISFRHLFPGRRDPFAGLAKVRCRVFTPDGRLERGPLQVEWYDERSAFDGVVKPGWRGYRLPVGSAAPAREGEDFMRVLRLGSENGYCVIRRPWELISGAELKLAPGGDFLLGWRETRWRPDCLSFTESELPEVEKGAWLAPLPVPIAAACRQRSPGEFIAKIHFNSPGCRCEAAKWGVLAAGQTVIWRPDRKLRPCRIGLDRLGGLPPDREVTARLRAMPSPLPHSFNYLDVAALKYGREAVRQLAAANYEEWNFRFQPPFPESGLEFFAGEEYQVAELIVHGTDFRRTVELD